MLSLVVKGVNFGIDFKGGTEVVVHFDQDVYIGDVRAAMDKTGFSKAEIKTFGSDRDILVRTPDQAPGSEIKDRIRAGLQANFPSNPFSVLREDTDRTEDRGGTPPRRDLRHCRISRRHPPLPGVPVQVRLWSRRRDRPVSMTCS